MDKGEFKEVKYLLSRWVNGEVNLNKILPVLRKQRIVESGKWNSDSGTGPRSCSRDREATAETGALSQWGGIGALLPLRGLWAKGWRLIRLLAEWWCWSYYQNLPKLSFQHCSLSKILHRKKTKGFDVPTGTGMALKRELGWRELGMHQVL